MRVVLGAFVATTMLAVVGCSTTAQNPNYQQTTKYRGSNPYTDKAVVQQATYQTQIAAPITYAPQEVPLGHAPQQAPTIVRQVTPAYQATTHAVTYEAPAATTQGSGIQENTESYGDGGTPGYYAVNGINPPAQTSAGQASGSQYAQIQTLSPQKIIPEPMPVPTGFTAIPTLSSQAGTIRHRVIVGDTLYSLARTTCSSVAEIQQMNTINAEFYIRVGEDIMVPSGRCVE